MFLQRRFIFVFLLWLHIVSSFTLGEEEPKYNSDTNTSSFLEQSTPWKKTRTRSLKLKQNATTNIEELSDKGRFLKRFDVMTCDGYILNIFRLTFQNTEPKHKEFPVLLVPGLYQSSDRFVKQNAEHSLAFILQDLGYDVWLANVRGNKYGRLHLYLEPDTDENTKFFDYSYDEIGLYDIAVITDYILNDTLKEKIHYIGHSLGGTAFLVLNSIQPVYNDKFETAHLLAPIGYQNHFPNKNFTEGANNFTEIYDDLVKKGKLELFPSENINKTFSVDECLGDKNYQNICEELKIDELMGLQKNYNSREVTRGGSVKLLAHLAQNVKYKTFKRWDYGEEGNLEHYKIKESPVYNLSHITTLTKIVYALNDEFVSPIDIADMAKNMANATTKEVSRKDFKHQDFIVARDVMETVYNDIIEDLRNINRFKELRKEETNDDDSQYEDDPVPTTKKPEKNVNKTQECQNTEKLSIPFKWRTKLLIWLPNIIIALVISICIIIFFCCLKKFQINFTIGTKRDKREEK